MNDEKLTPAQVRILQVMKGGGGKLGFDVPTQIYCLELTSEPDTKPGLTSPTPAPKRKEEPVSKRDIDALDALGYLDLANFFFDGISGTTYHDLTPEGHAALARHSQATP